MSDHKIRIEALKYDHSLHRSWDCSLVEETDELWEFVGIFSSEIKHPLLGVIRPGTISYEYYWKNRWYNVFRFHEPEGALRNFYCNVNQPPVLNDNVLTYVDLDIDILVAPDLSYRILDLEEFAENSLKHHYPAETIEKARASARELIEMIEAEKFPFNYKS